MAVHLVLGAGGIGRSVATALAAHDQEVVLISRSGRDPQQPGVRPLALDVTDAGALTAAARGAATIVNALNPASYTTWARDWPPMAAAALTAATDSGARLVTVDNLYAYGVVDAPMTESTPLRPNGIKGEVRSRMFADAMAAHEAGQVRAVHVRASDYIGATVLASSFIDGYLIRPMIAGKRPRLPMGRPDVAHSWTADTDVAALARELALTGDDTAYGRAWHVPSDTPATFHQVADLVSEVAGAPRQRVATMPRSVVTLGGIAVPLLRELTETRHQFERPWVLDSTAAQDRFGLRPTPLRDSIAATVAALRPSQDATR